MLHPWMNILVSLTALASKSLRYQIFHRERVLVGGSMTTKIKSIIKSFLKNVLGIQITRVAKSVSQKEKPKPKMIYVHDPASSYMTHPAYQDLLIDDLAQRSKPFFAQNYFTPDADFNLTACIRDFFDLYQGRALTDNTHGSGFHNAFWIYLISRALKPGLIVESGVWKGHTTWLLSKACPTADLYGFDKNLKHLEYDQLNANLHEYDWGTFKFPDFNPDQSLIFFDCHVNHAQRLIEAKSKGFKHLLFDDNPPVEKIFSHIPGIPTAAMLYTGQGLEMPEISWVWNDQQVTRTIDLDQARQAKELIKVHHFLPDVGGPTRYGGFAFLTYVQI
jgi:hypothetical protein